jgi:predicted pyridoxine 5'-phosphate oxidase superfamily flavin-nucleotide-binding protein
MSELYAERHRAFQDLFDSRRLADRLEASIVKHALDESDQRFIAARDMFFLATVDQHGRPTVSYKGGARS